MNVTRQEIARLIVNEFPTQEELAKACGLSQPAVALWLKRGIPKAWELYLRVRFPKMKAWEHIKSEATA